MKITKKLLRKTAAIAGAFFIAVMAAVPAAITVSATQRCDKKVTGTFLQSWLCSYWSDADWETELDYMDEAGIEYLVFGDVADRTDGVWTTKYPSQLPDLAGTNNNLDVVENVLRNCARHDIKVFLGMGMYDEFWTSGGIGNTFTQFCNISDDIAAEVFNRYHSNYPDTFYGWYFVPEFCNNYLNYTPYVSKFASGMNVIINRLNQLDPTMPMMLSPFFMKYYTTASVADTKTFWKSMINQINFRSGDILAPQDAVGAGWIEMSDLNACTRMYREAVDETNKGIVLWSNCESFTQSRESTLFGPPATENTTYITSPLDRYVQQMSIVSQYVDNIIMFSYNHYYSPKQNDSVFNNTYLDYLVNGTLETQCPTLPTRVKTTLQSDGSLNITWSGAADNIGLAAYRVLKNGSFMVRNDVSDGSGFNGCNDSDFSTSGQTTYVLQVIDGAGNVSSMNIVVDGSNPNTTVDTTPERFKSVVSMENVPAGIQPGINDTVGYFGNISNNGTNFLIETADGVGYQNSRGLRYSVPTSAAADAWAGFTMLPPSYTSAQVSGAEYVYFWVDASQLTSQQFSHMLLISETDTAGNETTVWTLNSSGTYYIENGYGLFTERDIANGYLQYPVEYKGYVKIPLSAFTPTYGTSDSNSGWGLNSINYIQFAFNSFDEWKGKSVSFDNFGFTGDYTDGESVPTQY